jgi:hypothetical protein
MILNGSNIGKILPKVIFIIFAIMMIVAIKPSTVLAASTNDTIIIDEQSIIANMDKLGIEKHVQDSLLNKISKGEIPDSCNPEKVNQVLEQLKISNQNPRAEYTFPDGSKIVIEITSEDIEKTNINPQSSFSYHNVGVRVNNTFMDGEFYAYIRLDKDYSCSGILDVYDPKITVISGSYWDEDLSILKINQDTSGPAHARLEWDYEILIYGVPAITSHAHLDLYVEDVSWWPEADY